MNPLEAIASQYRALNSGRKPPERGVIRMSSIGDQPRRLAMRHREDVFPPAAISDRGMRTFEVGDQRHDRLRQMLARSGAKGRIPLTKEDEEVCELDLGNGWKLRGHPDGVLYEATLGDGRVVRNVLLEVKTAGSMGWGDVVKGVVDEKYIDQASIYCKALGLTGTYFLYERKDTQALAEVFLPFDDARATRAMDRAREACLLIDSGFSPLDAPACSGDGYGWQTFKTVGEKLGWRCSYCPYVAHCFTDHVRYLDDKGKIVCRREKNVPADAFVVGFGRMVVVRKTWRMAEDPQ